MDGDSSLDKAFARACAAWPGVTLEREAFDAHVAACAGGEPADALHADDLFLACACLRGDRAALDAFDRAHAAMILRSVARFDLSTGDRDDLVQGLRVAFFVKGTIRRYSGRGPLGGWVRTAAVRAALDLVAARRPRPDDEDDLLGRIPATGDVELDLIRRRFADAFKVAFGEAMRELGPDDRLVLAQHYIDRLSIDQLAAVQGVHRATAARRVNKLRDALLAGTRARLEQRLALDATTFESLMRIAGSRLDVSVFRLMRD